MKKMMFTLLVAALMVPAFAQEKNVPQDAGKNAPALEMQRDHESFEQARQQHKAQLKAMKEKMEKLVKDYNKLKAGKKKDAKRAEIEQEVCAIHDKQLSFKKEQLAKFEERLARMKAEFEKESEAQAQKTWVEQKTDALIQADGNLNVLFDLGPKMHRANAPHHGFGKGPRGPRPNAPRPELAD